MATYTIRESVPTNDLMNETQPGEPVQPLLVMVTWFGVGIVAALVPLVFRSGSMYHDDERCSRG